jgi:hypothetical protein
MEIAMKNRMEIEAQCSIEKTLFPVECETGFPTRPNAYVCF